MHGTRDIKIEKGRKPQLAKPSNSQSLITITIIIMQRNKDHQTKASVMTNQGASLLGAEGAIQG